MLLHFMCSSYKCVVMVGGLFYAFCLLLLLLKKNEGDVHATMQLIDPSLNSPIPVVDLASECGLSNIKTALFDVHVLTHLSGWFITMLAFRDVAFCFICGLVWEIVEGSFEHSILELKECWWDKLFMDLLGCNNLGIFLGWIALRYFKIEEFNWAKISTPTEGPLHTMSWLYFIPGRGSLPDNHYGFLKSAKACMLFIYANLIIIVLQLNLFFLKTALWIPTVHFLPSWRSFFIASLILLSAPQIYKNHDITGFPLLMNTILALEGLLVLRFGTSLLFAGRGGDAISATLFMITCIFVFLVLSLLGITQLLSKSISKSRCKEIHGCKAEKVH